jgi:hypothetical protein
MFNARPNYTMHYMLFTAYGTHLLIISPRLIFHVTGQNQAVLMPGRLIESPQCKIISFVHIFQ